MRRPSLEFRIKMIVTGLALLLILFMTGTSLIIDYRRSVEAEREKMELEASVLSTLSAPEVAAVLRASGDRWRLMSSSKGSGFAIIMSDKSRWIVTVNESLIWGEVLQRQRHLLVAGMIGLLLAVEVAVLLAYSLTRPLKHMVWGCRQLAEGKWIKIPLSTRHFHELQILQRAFNAMVDRLRHWKKVELQVSRMERLAALGQLVAGVSHEVKNPLASMRIHVDLLRDDMRNEDRESLEMLSSELDRLNRTVSRLLSFARPQTPLMGPVSVANLFDWCHQMVRVQLSKFNITWKSSISDDDMAIWGDMTQLQQMILNLLLNAIREMKSGGTLSLTASRRDDRAIISISDTGPGLPPEIEDRIFDPFVTSHPDGTGLGLSIVLRIIDMHRGSIDVESSPEGTTFVIELPSAIKEGDIQ